MPVESGHILMDRRLAEAEARGNVLLAIALQQARERLPQSPREPVEPWLGVARKRLADQRSILKDNDGRRDYRFGELVSALGGNDVGVLQPPFSILPYDGASAYIGAGGGIKHRHVVIDNIPFAYAIPMLTGWELAYQGSDQHVKQIGTWIDRFSYEWQPGLATGTLRYTVSSELRADGLPDYYARHKVTILGLRPVTGGTTGLK